jgi:SAM-dependent methyltransferase
VSSSDEVLRYFDQTAEDFDSIYRADRSPLRRLRDRARLTVTKRLEFVEELAATEGYQSVLDVGCGSGRFGIALAQRGVRVLGLDFAPGMIELAEALAAKQGVAALTTFRAIDSLQWATESSENFDLSIAMGVFDYVEDPVPLLQAMASHTTREIVVSFPKLADPWVPIRWVKFKLARCPLFLYRRADVEGFARQAGLTGVSVVPFRRDFLLRAQGGAS